MNIERWLLSVARVAESDKGQELVQSLIKSAKPAALSPSPTLTSSAPWFTGTVQGEYIVLYLPSENTEYYLWLSGVESRDCVDGTYHGADCCN